MNEQRNSKKWYSAICASPAIVLKPHGLLEGEKATCYPLFQNDLMNDYLNQRVVVSNNCGIKFFYVVTSQGPATSIDLGLKLIELLIDKEKACEVGKALLINSYL